MSKYIIEIEDEPFGRNDDPVIPHGMDELYRAKGFNSLVFDQFGLDKLTPLDTVLEEVLEGAYQNGFEAGQHEASKPEYERGFNDAWEIITKIAKMPDGEREKVFGDCWISNILNKFSTSEIINILGGYEPEQDEIKVGDEVIALRGKAIVIRRYKDKYHRNNEDACEYWYYDMSKIDHDATSNLRKTGRHFLHVEELELLKAMKGGDA